MSTYVTEGGGGEGLPVGGAIGEVLTKLSGVDGDADWETAGAASVPDADATTKGKLQLAGDLGGTAASPTVPGLAGKQDAATAATDAELTTHAADTTAVHGITDTAAVVLTDDARLSDDRDPTAHTHPEADITGLVTDLAAKQPLDSDLTTFGGLTPTNDDLVQRKAGAWANRTMAQVKTDLVLVRGDVGLGNADDTADTAKPVSTAQQTALDLKQNAATAATDAELTAHTGDTANPHAVTKTQVGLANADNTSDAGKPVSTAQQTALDLKAPLASAALTGNPTAPTPAANDDDTSIATTAFVHQEIANDTTRQPIDSDLTAFAAIAPSNDDVVQRKAGAWTNRTMAQVKTDLALVKADVGLGNVDNVADASKPVSTAQQAALDLLEGGAVAIAYGASITPNADTTRVAVVGALTGNITINAPTGTPLDGQVLRFRFAQDATGSRTLTWNAAFAFGTDVTAALIPSTASAKWEMLFGWDAATSKWRALAIARGF